jgi:putative intracellular protease/amidase
MPPMTAILMPLPSEGFEPTEAAVPWKHLRAAGIDVVFATADGKPAQCDPLALEGVLFGQIGARSDDVATYHELVQDPAFQNPIRYEEIDPARFDGAHLAGGHAPGMKPYLESTVLQDKMVEFFSRELIVGAICHGPVLLARSVDPKTNRSVLHGKRLTGLTKKLERAAFWMTVWTLGRHFRTYPEYVQDEVKGAVGENGKFETGPFGASYDQGFTVIDGNLITARWPGDADALGHALVSALAAPDVRQLG